MRKQRKGAADTYGNVGDLCAEDLLGSYKYVWNEGLDSKQKVMKRDCPRNTRKLHLSSQTLPSRELEADGFPVSSGAGGKVWGLGV